MSDYISELRRKTKNDGTKVLRGKNYYLTEDINLQDVGVASDRIFVEKGVTNLCLNGHSITKNGTQIIDINQIDDQYAELNICDCKGTGKIQNTSSEEKYYFCIEVMDNSVLNIYSGTVDGGTYGGGISVTRTTGTKASAANIYGGKIQADNNSAIWIPHTSCALSVYGGEITSQNWYAVYVGNDEKNIENCNITVFGGKINSPEYSAVYDKGTRTTITIKDGELSSDGYYTLYLRGNGSKAAVENGKITGTHTKYSAVKIDGSNNSVEIKGGNVVGEKYAAAYCGASGNSLTISGGTVSSNADVGIRNCNGATTTISGGTVDCKGTYGIYNYNNGILNISGGNVSCSGWYGVYNEDSSLRISNGKLDCAGRAVYNTANGTAAIYGGEINSKQHSWIDNKGVLAISGGTLTGTGSDAISNSGILSISGGSFESEGESDNNESFIANSGTFNLSGSPVFRNASIWLKTDDNIRIAGALDMSEPCPVYIESSVPRIFTSGWSAHMQGKKPSDYFKSPYSLCTVAEKEGEALLRDFMITFNANGGCDVDETTVNGDGKASALPAASREGYTFDGWFTEKDGGEKITADTTFTGDTEVFAHWSNCSHSWNGEPTVTPSTCTVHGSKVYTCTVCGAEKTEELELAEHSYGGEWQSGGGFHWLLCEACGAEGDKTACVWNGEPSVTPSTCTVHGSKVYTCTVCGAEKTEELELAEHSYGGEWQSDDDLHWLLCGACGAEGDKTAHSWDDGEISEQPTENEAGVMLYTCAVCNATKTEPIAPLDHTHDWSDEWSKDDTYHWHDCLKNCGEKKDNAAHIWDGGTVTKQPTVDAEGEKTFECTVCGKIKTETLPPKDEPSEPDSGNITVDVQPGENAPDADFATPLGELTEAVLTPEEREAVGGGTDIRIILTVDDATESIPTDDKAKIEAAIRGLSGYKLGQYLDLNLLKIIGNSEGVRIYSLLQHQAISIKIALYDTYGISQSIHSVNLLENSAVVSLLRSSLRSSLRRETTINRQNYSSLHNLHRLLLVISKNFFVFYAVYLTGGGSGSAGVKVVIISL